MEKSVKIISEYVWIDGDGGLRSKTKTINVDNLLDKLMRVDQYPIWNYDGSSTKQANGDDSEVLLYPVAIYKDPFMFNSASMKHVLVLCETQYPDGSVPKTNNRRKAVEIFNKNLDAKPWYGIEQEFYLFGANESQIVNDITEAKYRDNIVFGSVFNNPKEQGNYYCGAGGENVFGRDYTRETYLKCIDAGLNVSGMNAEVGPGQWEIQVGPCEGIEAGDQLTIMRYIMLRVSEKYKLNVVLDPKPLIGDWNGSGCHTNYSTKYMREGIEYSNDEIAVAMQKGNKKVSKNGLEVIYDAIEKLGKKHQEHMEVYGVDNDKRMTGKHETASYETFSSGVADRSASIRIPREVEKNKQGYLEDRRPGSNMDPYLVTSKLFETTVL